MALAKRPDNPKGESSLAQSANETSGAMKKQKPVLSELAVPSFDKIAEYTDKRSALILEHSNSLTLEEVQMLMSNVQAAQRNITEGLNNLKAYRKVVSQLLEQRRREAAAARRQANKTVQPAQEAPIDVPDKDLFSS